MAEPTDTKHRLLERLKRATSASAAELAEEFGFTDTAIRQHLETLERAGLVERVTTAPSGRGRPPLAWRVTPASADAFPDRHADLTIELIDAVRTQLGEDALHSVLTARSARQKASYSHEVRSGSLLAMVQDLARLRTNEGYLAEAHDNGDGTVVLVEHHCPIAGAARTCTGLCTTELDVFRSVLGSQVVVERRQHLLAGDPRCDYTISPKEPSKPHMQFPGRSQ
jgi:predicted ArsR family transcriptional regulator